MKILDLLTPIQVIHINVVYVGYRFEQFIIRTTLIALYHGDCAS
nr:MAG TPA: hypothetical protein [Caudoviricetes sp.]